VQFVLAALAGLLAACSPAPPVPLATTVCELPGHAQRTVQIAATVSVDAAGATLISDPQCPATQIELRLSAAGTRSGAAEQLKSAAKAAVGSGKSSFPVKLSGVYSSTAADTYFVADSVSPAP
jgi:hypothetical protein